MRAGVVEHVRDRAGARCEYCRLPEFATSFRFWIDHVIPRQHGGGDGVENLAWCCPYCNRYKGPNLAGMDPMTLQIVALFNPRQDVWDAHFAWSGALLIGKSPTGRATIAVLAINRDERQRVRSALLEEGHVF